MQRWFRYCRIAWSVGCGLLCILLLVPIAGTGPAIPYWPLVFVTSLLAVAPWLPYRFSLRTLLIAITLIGLILGAIIYTTR